MIRWTYTRRKKVDLKDLIRFDPDKAEQHSTLTDALLTMGSNKQVLVEVQGRYSNHDDGGSNKAIMVDLVEQVSNPLSTLSSLFKALDSKAQWPVRPAPPSNCKTEEPNHQVQKWLTPEQIVGLVEAYRSGSTVKNLAASYEIHRTTVLEHLKRQGVPRRPSKLNQVDIDKAVRLYELGYSGEAVALELRVGASTIRREIKKAGVEIRGPGRRNLGG